MSVEIVDLTRPDPGFGRGGGGWRWWHGAAASVGVVAFVVGVVVAVGAPDESAVVLPGPVARWAVDRHAAVPPSPFVTREPTCPGTRGEARRCLQDAVRDGTGAVAHVRHELSWPDAWDAWVVVREDGSGLWTQAVVSPGPRPDVGVGVVRDGDLRTVWEHWSARRCARFEVADDHVGGVVCVEPGASDGNGGLVAERLLSRSLTAGERGELVLRFRCEYRVFGGQADACRELVWAGG